MRNYLFPQNTPWEAQWAPQGYLSVCWNSVAETIRIKNLKPQDPKTLTETKLKNSPLLWLHIMDGTWTVAPTEPETVHVYLATHSMI